MREKKRRRKISLTPAGTQVLRGLRAAEADQRRAGFQPDPDAGGARRAARRAELHMGSLGAQLAVQLASVMKLRYVS